MQILKIGNESRTVGAVQEMLAKLGFSPEGVDNFFGPKTEKAVIRFQESRGLFADGVVGPVTLEELEEAMVTYNRELASPGPDAADGEEGRLPFEKCKADPIGEDTTAFTCDRTPRSNTERSGSASTTWGAS